MTEHEIAADHIRRYPIEDSDIVCPPVIYDLPMTPIQALRGGDRFIQAVIVAAILALILFLTFLFAGG